MADDKLKTGPESPVLDHPGGGPAGDAQAVTKPPVPEEVEGPAAGTEVLLIKQTLLFLMYTVGQPTVYIKNRQKWTLCYYYF